MLGGFVTHLRRQELARSSSNALLFALAWHVASKTAPSYQQQGGNKEASATA